jgi:hypothetical protein
MKFLPEGWLQFSRSGFYFRREGCAWVQAVCLSFDVDDDAVERPRWTMISPHVARKYTRRPLWHAPDPDILLELNEIPKKMLGNENYGWALEIIAD